MRVKFWHDIFKFKEVMYSMRRIFYFDDGYKYRGKKKKLCATINIPHLKNVFKKFKWKICVCDMEKRTHVLYDEENVIAPST